MEYRANKALSENRWKWMVRNQTQGFLRSWGLFIGLEVILFLSIRVWEGKLRSVKTGLEEVITSIIIFGLITGTAWLHERAVCRRRILMRNGGRIGLEDPHEVKRRDI